MIKAGDEVFYFGRSLRAWGQIGVVIKERAERFTILLDGQRVLASESELVLYKRGDHYARDILERKEGVK